MSSGADDAPFIGVNWASGALRAYLIHPLRGMVDEFTSAHGVAKVERPEMAGIASGLATRWPAADAIYAAGMIGSAMGWVEVSYLDAPVQTETLAGALMRVRMGEADVSIVPGVACRRSADGAPDIMRGEEIELLGLAAVDKVRDGWVVLPGAHTKWARLSDGALVDFFTSMSGEIFDRLTTQGLLASVVNAPAMPDDAFRDGLAFGARRDLGLGTALFGARARVMRGLLERQDAASFIRGLLIGAEIADARELLALDGADAVHIVGDTPICRLYAGALAWADLTSRTVDGRAICATGFTALHAAARR